jgi:hypothetical protein
MLFEILLDAVRYIVEMRDDGRGHTVFDEFKELLSIT